MWKCSRKFCTILVLVFCLGIVPYPNIILVNAELNAPFFNITFLAPASGTARIHWASIIDDELPKIGIGVNLVETSWAQITPRSWSYPGPYPIPPYAEGGYDVLFVGWSWGLDWDPIDLYDSSSITPNGDNFYQYSNPEMDWAIKNYTSSLIFQDQYYWGKEMQSLLYEDFPQITLFYPMALITMDKDFTGWDGLLWENSFHTMENWSIPGQTEFRYAIPYEFYNFHVYSNYDYRFSHYSNNYDHWLYQIYSSLVTHSTDLTKNHRYVPNIASSIESTDGMNYTITLKSNVKFADGVQLNTSDIEFTYNLIMNTEFPYSGYEFLSENLYNNSITILSENECKISFKKPYLFQNNYLSFPILPKHIWNKVNASDHLTTAKYWAENYPNNLIGTGPYYLEEYNSTFEIIHLKRNEYYTDWTGITPYFEDIYFEYYSTKDSAIFDLQNEVIDMIDSNYLLQLDDVPTSNCKYELIDVSAIQEMAINNKHPYIGTGELCPISSPKSAKHIRKAISYMVPREKIISDLLDNLASPGITACPPAAIFFDDTLESLEYSIELARAEMVLAGYPSPYTKSFTFEINLPYIISIIGLIGGYSVLVRKIQRIK